VDELTTAPKDRNGGFSAVLGQYKKGCMQKWLAVLILVFIIANASGANLYWLDNDTLLSRFSTPAAVYNNLLVGGYTAGNGINSSSLIIWNGNSYTYGAKTDHFGNGWEMIWPVNDVGLFATTIDGSVRYLLKSNNGVNDFNVVATGMNPVSAETLGRCLIDCGRQNINGSQKHLLLYVEYSANPRIWYSADSVDANAGNFWTDLFGAPCPAISHFNGGIYVPNKGLYLFTGDSNSESSILFCSEADVGNSANNHGLITDPNTWFARWALGAGTRSNWPANYKSAYITGGNGPQWRTVDLVTADNKYAYWIPDNTPGQTGNSIYKIDFYNTTDSAGGTVTVLKSGGIPGHGWYGCISKDAIVYLSTIVYGNSTADGLEPGNDQYARIYAIDTLTDEILEAKKIARGDYNPALGLYPSPNSWFGFSKPLVEYGGGIWGLIRAINSDKDANGVSYVQSPACCGRALRAQLPAQQINIITNPNFAIGPSGLDGWQFAIYQFTFDRGKSAIPVGATVTGGNSGASAIVASVTVSSGDWADANATGYINLTSSSGDFDFADNEELYVGAADFGRLQGGVTFQVIDDPTGGSGKVLKCRFKCSGLTSSYDGPAVMWPSSRLTTLNKNALCGNFETMSCKFYIKGDESSTDLATQLFIYPNVNVNYAYEITVAQNMAENYATQKNTWQFISISEYVPFGSTTFYHRFYPHSYKTDGKSGCVYVKDLQLVASALPNEYYQSGTTFASPACSNKPFMDVNNDCLVNFRDLFEFASEWLTCGAANQSACTTKN
jgi:hypothetical protein